jgi:hypothetical protein
VYNCKLQIDFNQEDKAKLISLEEDESKIVVEGDEELETS